MNNNIQFIIDSLPDFEIYLRIDRDVSFSTLSHHLANLKMFCRYVTQFDKESLRSFLYSRKSEVSAGSIENYIFTIRVYCDYLIYKGLLDTNWGRSIPLPKREYKVPIILTTKEVQKILDIDLPLTYSRYPDSRLAKENFDCILTLLATTGARVGEVLNITMDDINWVEGAWTLNHTKTRQGRIVPIPPNMLSKLKHLAGDRAPNEHLFINPFTHTPIRIQQVETNFNRRKKKADIKKSATVHSLRHSFIVEMFRQDISVLKIANIVGHENIKTTQNYAKLLVEDLRDAIMRHPITAKQRNPYDILVQLKETIEKFHLKEDTRFMVNIDDSNEGLRVSVFIR